MPDSLSVLRIPSNMCPGEIPEDSSSKKKIWTERKKEDRIKKEEEARNIDMGKRWTIKEKELLKEKYEDHSAKKLSEILGRTEQAIYAKAFELGLTNQYRKWWLEDETHECRVCGQTKPVSDFRMRNYDTGRRRTICKDCAREKDRKRDRDRNISEESKRKHRLYARERYRKNYELIKKLKDKPCARCSEKFPPCAMDFHHPDEEKKEGRIKATLTEEKIKERASKCLVTCSNCHRIITNKGEPEESSYYKKRKKEKGL